MVEGEDRVRDGDSEGRDAGRSRSEGEQRPRFDMTWMAAVGEEAGGGVRIHGDVEMVEGK